MNTTDIRNIGAAWDLFDELREQKNDQTSNGDPQQCPKCSRGLEDNDRAEGYRVCPACGTVTAINVDDKAVWQNSTDMPRTKASSTNGKAGAASQRLQRSHQWNRMTSMERSMHQTMRYFE